MSGQSRKLCQNGAAPDELLQTPRFHDLLEQRFLLIPPCCFITRNVRERGADSRLEFTEKGIHQYFPLMLKLMGLVLRHDTNI